MSAPIPRKRGRPVLPPGAAKTSRVQWLTTPTVHAQAKVLAEAAGLSLSAWLTRRIAVPGKAVKPRHT